MIALVFACKSQPQIEEEESVIPVDVLEPEFEIVSIIVIQADLVNTQFETVLKVNNPNEFALQLSSLKYQLYGNGLFWADGARNDILQIPARSSSETKFRFSMNFINMNRRLLDDIIAMRQVRYRFRGEAEIQPDITNHPHFVMNFDITSLSDVKQKAD
jgi:LEA14-like dessication related protein